MNNSCNDLISIVICSVDEKKFAAVSRNLAECFQGEAHEIIGIHDAQSLCEGYNRGARQSSGAILIFCHDDIEIVSPDFKDKIHRHLANYDIVGVAGCTRLNGLAWMSVGQPHIHGVVSYPEQGTTEFYVLVYGAEKIIVEDIQALDGLFIAMNRMVWETRGFDEKTFDGFHGYDVDFTYSAYLSGFRLAVCNDIAIIHQSIGAHGNDWYKYRERFLDKYQGKLSAEPAAPAKRGAISVQSRKEILEMMQPHILGRITNDIRALAEKEGLANKVADSGITHPFPTEGLWKRLLGSWRKKN